MKSTELFKLREGSELTRLTVAKHETGYALALRCDDCERTTIAWNSWLARSEGELILVHVCVDSIHWPKAEFPLERESPRSWIEEQLGLMLRYRR